MKSIASMLNSRPVIERLQVLVIWLIIFSTWEGAWRIVHWKSYIFPAPSHIIDATFHMAGWQTYLSEPLQAGWPLQPPKGHGHGNSPTVLFKALGVSLTRLAVGFAISLVVGVLIGMAMWRFPLLDRVTGPLFLGFQTLPSVCWVPLAVLTLGLTELAIMFVLIIGSMFAAALSMRDGMRTIPPIYRRAGEMLAARGWRLYRYVLFPASLPAMATSLRQGFSFAWRSLMGAELIFLLQNKGVGFLLAMGREFNDVAQVIAVMIIMILIAMTIDRWIFAGLEHRIRHRFGLIAQ